MSKGRLKLSYKIEGRISKSLDDNMNLVALDEGFEAEPYATGFNFQNGDRELIYDKR